MKTHSTNYFDTFIDVAEDTKTNCSTKPPIEDQKAIAERLYELIANNPYKSTSDDIFFQVFTDRNDLAKQSTEKQDNIFFQKVNLACGLHL